MWAVPVVRACGTSTCARSTCGSIPISQTFISILPQRRCQQCLCGNDMRKLGISFRGSRWRLLRSCSAPPGHEDLLGRIPLNLTLVAAAATLRPERGVLVCRHGGSRGCRL